MTIVKAVELRKRLKELLEKIYNGEEESLVLDYYGKYFEIKPLTTDEKGGEKTETEKFIEKYSNLPKLQFYNPIFNEADPAQEKANIRELMAKRYYDR